ncbi:MAG: di-trans,poly-cis-decaprenylcistransferase [Amoebophilaceae bacterium]|nr:di-trans,poly-cis-decaprenylcistransferase [Amoebophilaceae bacterium]
MPDEKKIVYLPSLFSLRKILFCLGLQFCLLPTKAPPLVKARGDTYTFLTKPNHIAIIMDGNGRWGKEQYGNRSAGHMHAKGAVKEVIEECLAQKISYLTLYAFSTENWGRSKEEIQNIFHAITEGITENLASFIEHHINFRVIGNTKGIPTEAWLQLQKAVEATKNNTNLYLTVAINYGGKEETIAASEAIARAALYDAVVKFQKQSTMDTPFSQFIEFLAIYHPKISSEMYETYLYTCGLPPVDLVIRTGGKKRLSNFLPWQIAYAEIYFMDLLWPNFRRNNLIEALLFFQEQHRTFGLA